MRRAQSVENLLALLDEDVQQVRSQKHVQLDLIAEPEWSSTRDLDLT